MSEVKVILFDADGVVVRTEKPFSHVYAAEKGFDPSEITPFFAGDFQKALVGEADLKQLLERHRTIWRWDGSHEELMTQWFEAEHVIDNALVEEIKVLRELGLRCILATNQEQYRAEYLENKMFPGVFDRTYSSAALGVKKPNAEFYNKILSDLAEDGVQPDEVVYFDDDAENVEAASKLGIHSVLYKGISDFYVIFKDEVSK